MENISITPKSLNRYPVDIRAIDVTEKVAVNIEFEKNKVDFVLGNQAVLPKSGFFNKYFNDLTKIKDCYNRGITFWNDHVNYRNYTLPNEIINKEA